MKKRKSIPLSVKLKVALCQLARLLGVEPGDLQLDHDQALNFRPKNEAGTDTVPPANDPASLIWRASAPHKIKTFGPGGERRIHTRGGDRSEPGRLDKIAEKHVEFRKRVLSLAPKPEPRKSRWRSRGFAKRKG